ncbi:MAG: fumarylacetoacetate hydrolase family protein [Anaerolineales bacterium]
MKLLTFSTPQSSPRPGLLLPNDWVLPLPFDGMLELIEAGAPALEHLRTLEARHTPQAQADSLSGGYRLSEVSLHPPLPNPPSLRDFYAFEQHVATANANRGRKVPAEWYEIPVFYFSNHMALFGPDAPIQRPRACRALDYELEVACIIGKGGRDISPERAEAHIFGYTIFNDWSARDLQAQEMRVGLGPAKGKDFASSFGPVIVTPDELTDRHTRRPGVYRLQMTARVNGVERSRGNFADLHYSFGEMIARASADVTLHPGEILGSGTVGTGCLLELTHFQGPWLADGDVVELEIERIGILRNRVTSPTPSA